MRFEKQLNAHAKINLFLYMSGYRDDGYHLLYSLMQSVELSDVVRISVSENESSDANVLSYSLSGLLINDTGRNSVMDAIELYMNAVSENGYKVHANIDKRIPDRAGLGGGSADAAAALTLINEAFSNRLSQESLAELGLAVGADVPFALRGGAVLCRGVGEIMNDVPPFSGLHILLIKPDIGISTVQAYQAFDRIRGESLRQSPRTFDDVDFIDDFSEDVVLRVNNKKASWGNDFESVAFDSFPVLSDIKSFLLNNGAIYASMSGSGSTMFGCYSDEKSLETAFQEAKNRFGSTGFFIEKTKTVPRK